MVTCWFYSGRVSLSGNVPYGYLLDLFRESMPLRKCSIWLLVGSIQGEYLSQEMFHMVTCWFHTRAVSPSGNFSCIWLLVGSIQGSIPVGEKKHKIAWFGITFKF
jgi:hypothetical protein